MTSPESIYTYNNFLPPSLTIPTIPTWILCRSLTMSMQPRRISPPQHPKTTEIEEDQRAHRPGITGAPDMASSVSPCRINVLSSHAKRLHQCSRHQILCLAIFFSAFPCSFNSAAFSSAPTKLLLRDIRPRMFHSRSGGHSSCFPASDPIRLGLCHLPLAAAALDFQSFARQS
jgi:hypothetical protein